MVKVTPTAGQNPQSRALGLSKESATLVWNFIINEAFAEAGFDAEKESFGPHEKPTPGSTMQRVIDSTVAKFPDLFKPDELTKDCLAKLASLVRRACQAPKRKVSVIQAVLRNKIQREMETAARTKRTHNEMLGGEEDAEETSAVAVGALLM